MPHHEATSRNILSRGQIETPCPETGSLRRRTFLKTAGLLCGGLACPDIVRSEVKRDSPIKPFRRYSELLESLGKKHKLRELGRAPDGSPIVTVQAGGNKKPAIFISAGSHATEHAGVVAAVRLIDELETEHRVYVIPCRDPIGMSGFRHALGMSLGEKGNVESLAAAEKVLREEGEILYESDGTLLTLIGEYGYANRGLYRRIEKGAEFLEPLKGRRIYFPSRHDDRPGAGPLERAYTLIVTPEGEILHLNRFHDTSWAPVEVRCTRRLMAEIDPKLTFDLHEYGGDSFWMSARRQRTDTDEIWERRMALEAARAVAATGAKKAAADYSPGSFFTRLDRGVYWLDPSQRGEGLNLVDFAARKYGPGFTVETGMRQPFHKRVEIHMQVVKTAVKLFEERHAKK